MSEKASPLVLIVEDDKSLSLINRRALESEGYRVQSAVSLDRARELIHECNPDVILLDVKLPDGSGIELCREIRQDTMAYIIFLTSATAPSDELEALRAGGNDYLRKPYGIDLLRARVSNAVLRKRMTPQFVRCGRLTLDIFARRAYIDEADAKLTQIEFSLLLYLLQNEDQIISAENIYEKVWGQPLANDKNALSKTVSQVRKRIEPAEYTINAVYGKGYIFERI